MKKVKPYKSETAALKSLDNGGRFYNVLTKADDGEISSAELSRVAGVFASKPLMNLYLDMALAELPNRERVLSSLSDELAQDYQSYRPKHLTPTAATQSEHVGHTAIITGTPTYQDSKTKFCGFIMVPIVAGSVTTFMMIPIMDEYHVYEIRDHASDKIFLLAHARTAKKLAEVHTRFGGYLKELQVDDPTGKQESEKRLFLEVNYYTRVL